MIGNRSIIIEIGRLKDLEVLVETYETIAATSMRRIRDSVLYAREFHQGLMEIFKEVTTVYTGEVLVLMEQRRIRSDNKLSLIRRNGKTVYVLASANTGLYGEIINKTLRLFVSEYKRRRADVVIIGKLGIALFEQALPGVVYTAFDFPDDRIDPERLKKIIEHIGRYEKVVMFYGMFKQATVGDCTTERPGLLDQVARAKWYNFI